MSECDSMLDAGTWPGGYVKYDDGSVGYIPKGQAMVYGYSGSGSGSDWHGSDYEFCTGSYEWNKPDTDEKGSDNRGKAPVTGNEGGTGTGENTGGAGGGYWSVGESSIGREKIINAATAYIGPMKQMI